jgi:hypothetical protein
VIDQEKGDFSTTGTRQSYQSGLNPAAEGGQLYWPGGQPVAPGSLNDPASEQNFLNTWGNYDPTNNLHGFLSGVGTTLARVGAGGALALAPGLAPAIGGVGGAAAAGAATGALSAGAVDSITGRPMTLGSIGKGAATGAISGGLGYAASPATGALSNATGLSAPASSALVKGAVGAGVGALGSAIRGGNISTGALTGGVGGALNGAVGNATGSSQLGNVAGTIGGTVAGRLAQPSAPTMQAPPAQSPPTMSTAMQGMPSLPPVAGMPSTAYPANMPSAASSPANIGSYSGYGYAPRQEVQNPVQDYSTYGQGPEAQFFKPQGT